MIYYFTASWCAPCNKTRPIAEELNHSGIFEILDVDNEPEMVSLYKIRSVPTFVAVDSQGNEMFRVTGAQTKQDLVDMIQKVSA